MAARAVASCTISFGLVSIPVKLFTAASAESVRFNMLSKKSGGRVKMQYYDPASDEVIGRDETLKGYEYAKGQYVTFTEEELKALEADRKNTIEILEFVPEDEIHPVWVEKSYYLGPDKGGDRAYKLLTRTMGGAGRVAIGKWAARGKEHLVAVRPHGAETEKGKGGLLIHQLYYANEVRSFEDTDTGATFEFSEAELNLAQQLIDQLSREDFDASKYHDQYAERVKAAVDQKVAGQEVTIAPEQPKAQIIDLFEALKRSLSESPGDAEAPSASAAEGEGKAASQQPAAEAQGNGPGPKKSKPRKAREGSEQEAATEARPPKKASARSRKKKAAGS